MHATHIIRYSSGNRKEKLAIQFFLLPTDILIYLSLTRIHCTDITNIANQSHFPSFGTQTIPIQITEEKKWLATHFHHIRKLIQSCT